MMKKTQEELVKKRHVGLRKRYKTLSSVMPVIVRETKDGQEILLARRYQTGYMDGYWDYAGAGHVDENETARQTLQRECLEEIGIQVEIETVEFALLTHFLHLESDLTYYNLYFWVRDFSGEPRIMEADKCDDLKWFGVDNLPENFIPKDKLAWEAIVMGKKYLDGLVE